MILPKSVQNLTDEFAKLPGIGPKTASRLVFFLLTKSNEDVEQFGNAVANLKSSIHECDNCFTITDAKICAICSNPKRDEAQLMVVSEPLDVVAMERAGFQGRYLVIGGVISPIDGIGPDDLRIRRLLDRLRVNATIKEVILATDPSLEGEATALYITKEIRKHQQNHHISPKLVVTRLARGLPIGSELEYADELTLMRAFEGRKEY